MTNTTNNNSFSDKIIYSIIIFFILTLFIFGGAKYLTKKPFQINSISQTDIPSKHSTTSHSVNIDKINISDEMIFIKGGTFQMGSNSGYDNEKPIHSVTLNDYHLGKNEVTFSDYKKYCIDTGKSISYDHEGWENDKYPVIHITWYEAIAYCNWLSKKENLSPVYTINGINVSANFEVNGYRLPTEAEWEYAARNRGKNMKWEETNSKDSLFLYGNYSTQYGAIDKDGNHKIIGFIDNYPFTAPIGSFRANSLGLYDMIGNVGEWCWDWKGDYSFSSKSNPKGALLGSKRIVRGGSWASPLPYLSFSRRDYYSPEIKGNSIGFRLSKSN